jgi:hypothetical protein
VEGIVLLATVYPLFISVCMDLFCRRISASQACAPPSGRVFQKRTLHIRDRRVPSAGRTSLQACFVLAGSLFKQAFHTAESCILSYFVPINNGFKSAAAAATRFISAYSTYIPGLTLAPGSTSMSAHHGSPSHLPSSLFSVLLTLERWDPILDPGGLSSQLIFLRTD